MQPGAWPIPILNWVLRAYLLNSLPHLCHVFADPNLRNTSELLRLVTRSLGVRFV
jgi:hypothetical protein